LNHKVFILFLKNLLSIFLVGEADVEICSLQEPTSDSQKAHYFQWIQVQDWETGFLSANIGNRALTL
jgi:hypothetical protein